MKYAQPSLCALLLIALAAGCSNSTESAPRFEDPPEPAFMDVVFTNPLQIDHQWFPLYPGTVMVYQAIDDDDVETQVVEVLSQIRVIDGVASRVVQKRVFEGDVLVESAEDYFAQDDEGHVWSMGASTDEFEYDEAGSLVNISHEGAWESGKDVAGKGYNAVAGIYIKALPVLNDSWHQEFYAGVAEGKARVTGLEIVVTLADGTKHNCLKVVETDEIETDEKESKDDIVFFKPGVGVVREENVGGDTVELMGVFRQGSGTAMPVEADFSKSTIIDNAFFPVRPGQLAQFVCRTGDAEIFTTVEATSRTRLVMGVPCVVVEFSTTDGESPVQERECWFCQDGAGNVWWMGQVVFTSATEQPGAASPESWEAGKDGAAPGILVMGDHGLMSSYQMEARSPAAGAWAMVVRRDARVVLAGGTEFADCLQIVEWSAARPHELRYRFHHAGTGLLRVARTDGSEVFELVDPKCGGSTIDGTATGACAALGRSGFLTVGLVGLAFLALALRVRSSRR
ncbi:MAG: hypothetical protein K8I27_09885 [Planctomycetes bacterium]|nr:hypothetical protein [Planctomycetota bacterium]